MTTIISNYRTLDYFRKLKKAIEENISVEDIVKLLKEKVIDITLIPFIVTDYEIMLYSFHQSKPLLPASILTTFLKSLTLVTLKSIENARHHEIFHGKKRMNQTHRILPRDTLQNIMQKRVAWLELDHGDGGNPSTWENGSFEKMYYDTLQSYLGTLKTLKYKSLWKKAGNDTKDMLKKLDIVEEWQKKTNENPNVSEEDNLTNLQRRISEDRKKMIEDGLPIYRSETLVKMLQQIVNS